jgi:hypothetical protein
VAGTRDPNGALAVPGSEPSADTELVGYLERDQLTADTAIPLPRAQLSRRAKTGLWLLRVAVILIGAMVVYTFAAKLA